ncbi:alpha-amylase family glycosyl hydrolase [Bacillus sp. JJ1764]|uniref:alpha-amylase family glycosyl hydrolase n=1 Tax=Bacillus sp. JJ1764 TaxID=3122964 RepID=UPI002FFE88A9
MPGYYFRHNELGLPSNGTGVGNDLASERRMVRKLITDSIRYWIEEYHIDGFRFDLMGILDVETMNEVRQVCDSFNKEMVIIGEGWDLNTPLPFEKKAIIANQSVLPRIGHFNDRFRDHMKGNTFELTDKGYGLGNAKLLEAAIEAVTGSIGLKNKDTRLFAEPYQSVNYVECHDNHTLWDKLIVSFPQTSETTRMSYHRLLTGLVILSQGIPFLHSGQEFFRTKQGDGNSYRSSNEINRLDWERKMHYKENVEYVKGLIQIRKNLSCFRLKTAEEIRQRFHTLPVSSPLIGCIYKMDDYEVILLINPSQSAQYVSIPEGDWSLVANHEMVGITSNVMVKDGEVKLEAISLNVLLKKYLPEIT